VLTAHQADLELQVRRTNVSAQSVSSAYIVKQRTTPAIRTRALTACASRQAEFTPVNASMDILVSIAKLILTIAQATLACTYLMVTSSLI